MNGEFKEYLELVNQQIKELVGIYRGAVSRSGISENEFWVWYSLVAGDDECSQQDICSTWSLSKQTVNTIVMHMAQKGFVTLEVVPGTRNRKNIRLTQAGREYGEIIVTPISQAERKAFEKLPLENWIACTRAFSQYIDALKEEIRETKQKQKGDNQ